MADVRPLSPALDKRVVDPAGEPVGRVRELLFDSSEGRIEYVCIAMQQPGTDNDIEAVIPWSAVVPPSGGAETWRVLAPKTALQRIARLVPNIE